MSLAQKKRLKRYVWQVVCPDEEWQWSYKQFLLNLAFYLKALWKHFAESHKFDACFARSRQRAAMPLRAFHDAEAFATIWRAVCCQRIPWMPCTMSPFSAFSEICCSYLDPTVSLELLIFEIQIDFKVTYCFHKTELWSSLMFTISSNVLLYSDGTLLLTVFHIPGVVVGAGMRRLTIHKKANYRKFGFVPWCGGYLHPR